MKPISLLIAAGIVVAASFGLPMTGVAAEATPNVSVAIDEVVRLSEAGVDAATIQTYVESLRAKFKPQAADVLYMHQHGVPSSVIKAIILHDPKEPAPYAEPYLQAQQQPAPAAPAYSPAYSEGAGPVYRYDDGLWPSLGLSFSFGFPHFGFGFHHRFAGPFRHYRHY